MPPARLAIEHTQPAEAAGRFTGDRHLELPVPQPLGRDPREQRCHLLRFAGNALGFGCWRIHELRIDLEPAGLEVLGFHAQ
jgi:hypothetical protein